MNDRELLELAAKSCGYDTSHPWNADRLAMDQPVAALCIDGVSTWWNPLEDDGHALRLAVKLHIGVRCHGPDHWQLPNVSVSLYDLGDSGGRVQCANGDNPGRATRRSIVLAAAALASNAEVSGAGTASV